jgi:uncharacterized protein YjbI with pentapeptide repeats
MADTCEYAARPEGDGLWECPRSTYVDTEYCVFHLSPESRDLMGVTESDIRNSFVRRLEEAVPGEDCRFVGANFGETVVNADTIGKNADVIDLRESEFDGTFDISGATVEADLILDDSSLRRFNAPKVVFKGDVSFRGCGFEGKVNLDGARFEGDVSFEKATFELNAELSGTVFEGDVSFRNSVHKGVKTLFKNAEFRGNVRMNNVTFDRVEFTGSEFRTSADFSRSTFNKEAKLQYVDFLGSTDFGKVDFNGNTSFRGTHFATYANFKNASFQGWASFIEIEFDRDASFESVWFKSELRVDAESKKNAVIHFERSRMGKASFEVDPYKPVVFDFTKARIGRANISMEGKVNNPLDNVRFIETEFNGFRFSEYADYLAEKDYVIHDSVVKKDEELSVPRLEKTYRIAAEAARGDSEKIASEFAKKEAKYRRQRYKDEGDTLSYYSDLAGGYGIYLIILLVLVVAAVGGFLFLDEIQSLLPV